MKEYIKLLDLPEKFDLDNLKKAYREKVLKYHPDKATNEAERIGYEEILKKLNEAYEYLKDYLEDNEEQDIKPIPNEKNNFSYDTNNNTSSNKNTKNKSNNNKKSFHEKNDNFLGTWIPAIIYYILIVYTISMIIQAIILILSNYERLITIIKNFLDFFKN